MRVALLWLVALGLVALVAVCCGGPSPSVAPWPRPPAASLPAAGPCALIADVAGALGRGPIASPNAYALGPTERCMWVVARDPSRYVGLSVGSAANHAASIDAMGNGDPVEGLGDDARWWPAARTLSVAIGDRSIQVDLQLDDAEVTRELAVELARQALEGLGSGG